MAPLAIRRMFRPSSLFGIVSLLTATEFLTITLLINKVSGFYGILALFTGFQLSAVQLSMYIYSIMVFALVCYLGPHIRAQSPLQNLLLAWVYIFDTLINIAYTSLFGLAWFITLAQHLNPESSEDYGNDPVHSLPGGKTINDTAGFTDPTMGKVDKVEVVAKPSPDAFPPGQEATAFAYGDGSDLENAVFQTGSLMSISVICILWFVRLYMVIIVMSYARSVLRSTMAANAYTFQSRPHSRTTQPSRSPAQRHPDTPSTAVEPSSADGQATLFEGKEGRELPDATDERMSPFDRRLPDGEGWRGKLGRILSSFPQSYWLGNLERSAADDAAPDWARGAEARFRQHRHGRGSSHQPGTVLKTPVPPPSKGTVERERRARKGTGPPPPGFDVANPGQPRVSGEVPPAEIRSATRSE